MMDETLTSVVLHLAKVNRPAARTCLRTVKSVVFGHSFVPARRVDSRNTNGLTSSRARNVNSLTTLGHKMHERSEVGTSTVFATPTSQDVRTGTEKTLNKWTGAVLHETRHGGSC